MAERRVHAKAAGAAFLLACSSASAADYTYTIISPPAGYSTLHATGIDKYGHVVGYYDNGLRPTPKLQSFIYANGGMTIIPPAGKATNIFEATAVSDNGRVVGFSAAPGGSVNAIAEYTPNNARSFLAGRVAPHEVP